MRLWPFGNTLLSEAEPVFENDSAEEEFCFAEPSREGDSAKDTCLRAERTFAGGSARDAGPAVASDPAFIRFLYSRAFPRSARRNR